MNKKTSFYLLILMAFVFSILSVNCKKSPTESDGPGSSTSKSEDLSKYPDTTWDKSAALGQRGEYPFAGIYKYNKLTINDNVEITSRKISNLVVCVNTLSIGKSVKIRVRNGFYESSPVNLVSELKEDNLKMSGLDAGNFCVYENMFGKGGNGGNGENGTTAQIYSTFYGEPGGGGGGGYGGGIGGKAGTRYGSASKGQDNGYGGGSGGNEHTSSKGGYADDLGGNGQQPRYFNSGGCGGGGNGGKGAYGGYDDGGSNLGTIGGSGGDGGGYGGGVLIIVAKKIEYNNQSLPKFIVSGQQGGKGGYYGGNGEDGQGGLLIIECPDINFPNTVWNLGYSTYGQHIVPSNNGGHGIVTGNPQKVFVNGKVVF